jgi:hypothetical protein
MEIARHSHEFGAGVSQPAQCVDSDGIGRKEVGQVDAYASGARRADATQLVHLFRSQVSG